MIQEEFENDAADIRLYLDEFTTCSELASVPLPSADLIWWRAQLANKRKLAQRSVRAIDAVCSAAIVAALALMLVLIAIWSPSISAALALPVPVAVAALVLFACSTGGVLLAWARQR